METLFTAFDLLQRLAIERNAGDNLETLLQNISTIHCSGANWMYISEGEMIDALKKELGIK